MRNTTRRLILLANVLLASVVSSSSVFAIYDNLNAAPGEVPFSVPDGSISDYPGENISMPSFQLSLVVADVSIPGPAGLDLVFQRRYAENVGALALYKPTMDSQFDNLVWRVDLPSIRLVTGGPQSYGHGCVGQGLLQVYLPGSGEVRTVGFASSSSLKSGTVYAFDSGEILTCEGGNPNIYMANGQKYHFEQHGGEWELKTLSDRFGNVITYNYTTTSGYRLLSSISRNDGASIQITNTSTGSGYRITRVSAHGRQVDYGYSGDKLTSVTDPEGRVSSYQYLTSPDYRFIVTLPTGATINYELIDVPPAQSFDTYKRVLTKTISGPNMPSRSFSYERPGTAANYGRDPASPNNRLKATVREYDYQGTQDLVTTHLFHRVGGTSSEYLNANIAIHGRAISTEVRLGSSLVYKRENTWASSNAGTVGCNYGIALYYMRRNCGRALLENTKQYYYNAGGTDVFESDPLTFDVYGNPIVTKLVSQSGAIRYEKNERFNKLEYWLIGRTYKNSVSPNNSTWTEVLRLGYHHPDDYPSTVEDVWEYGQRVRTYDDYHASGDLEKVTYHGTGTSRRYSNYKRGVPRTEEAPRRYTTGWSSLTRVVDDFGNITSENDHDGVTTTFTFDDLSRNTSVNYSDPQWSDETTTYYDSQRYSVTTKGNFRAQSNWDGLGRFYLGSQEDVSISGTKRSVRVEREKSGRIDFRTHPYAGSSSTNGIQYTYDALGRRIQEYIAETGTSRHWEYQNGNRIRYTDGKNHQTFTTYQAYGTQSYDLPTLISQPEGVSTTINYTIVDQIDLVTQGTETEDYIYDSNHRLCKTVRDDIGKIGYGYQARTPIWRSHGKNGSSTGCGGEYASDKITYTYDNQGDLETQTLSNGDIYKEYERTENGFVTKVISEGAQWSYLKNDLNLVEQETLTGIGGTYIIDWEYDGLGNVESIEYPNNQTVTFSPNALGQPTQAGTYATSASYHPTGTLDGFTYGNGIVRSYQHNAVGVPLEIRDFYGSSRRFEHDYDWDAEFNVEDIDDRQNSLYSVNNITYDGLERIQSATGQWGTSDFDYDQNSNIKKMRHGTETFDHLYDSKGRLSSTNRNGSNYASYAYDSRGNLYFNDIHYLTFNAANQLTNTSGYGTRTFKYDGHGRRVQKVQNSGTTNQPQYTTHYAYGQGGKLYYKKHVGGHSTNYIYLGDTQVAEETSGTIVNSPPNANYYRLYVDENTADVFSPLRNDNDPDGDALRITSVSSSQITIHENGTTLFFGGGSSGFTFSYTVSDGRGGSATANVRISVD